MQSLAEGANALQILFSPLYEETFRLKHIPEIRHVEFVFTRVPVAIYVVKHLGVCVVLWIVFAGVQAVLLATEVQASDSCRSTWFLGRGDELCFAPTYPVLL